MGFLDSITSWFRKEAADVKESVSNLESDLDADLSRKERELAATPEERLDMIQEEIDSDDAFADIQAKLDGKQAHADAVDELSDSPDAD